MGSGVLKFSICLTITSIIIAIVAFFLPFYVIISSEGVLDNAASTSTKVELKLRDYSCSFTNSIESILDVSSTFSYEGSAGIECTPILTPLQDYTNLGKNMKVCLAFLALGVVGSFISVFFQIIMSCQNSCRNCCMKCFIFILSLTPVIFFVISALALLAITHTFNSQSDIGSGSADIDFNLCQLYWCNKFFGSDSGSVSLLADGNVSWKPDYGWFLVLVSALLSLLSSFTSLCTPNHKKHHLDHCDENDQVAYRYTKLVNQ